MLIGLVIISIFIFLIFLNKSEYKKVNEKYIPQEKETENKLFVLINNERKERGLRELKSEALLDKICEEKCDEMILDGGEPNHDGFQIRFFDSKASNLLETVGYGFSSDQSYFFAYMNSKKGHKEILLNKNSTHIGIFTKGNYNCCLFANY